MNPPFPLQQWWQELSNKTPFLVNNPLIFLFIFLFSFLYLIFNFTRSSAKLNLPPSPPKLPIIGNLHQVGPLLHRCFQKLADKYGSLVLLKLGKNPILIVSSPEISRKIFNSNEFSNRPQTKVVKALFYGCSDVSFCPLGDYWRQVRKICMTELLSQKRVQSFRFIRENEVAKTLEKIRVSSMNKEAVNLSHLFAVISNHLVSRSAFGRVYNEGEANVGEGFTDLAKSVLDLLGAFCFEDLFPFLGWMDNLTGLTAKLRNTFQALDRFLDQVIEEHEIEKKKEDDESDVVDLLLHLQKDGSLDIELTRENIKAILLDMFVGGTDSTTTTMEWAMSELVKNPRIMTKAQEEVRRVVRQKPKSKIDEIDIAEMKYLKCIVKETLRLHAPFMITRQTSTCVKLEGYDIPPKTIVFIDTWTIQRDSALWVKPEEFIPERFEDNSVDFIGQHYEFAPFGGGRRSCPGILFATVEMEYVLANLLFWFDWELPDGKRKEELDTSDVYSVLIRKKTPLCLLPIVHTL